MFKGLRTKIESEQKGQTSQKPVKSDLQPQPKEDANTIVKPAEQTGEGAPLVNDGTIDPIVDTSTTAGPSSENNDLQVSNDKKLLEPSSKAQNRLSNLETGEGSLLTIESLRNEVSRLNDELRSVIKERDENTDQNAQLYQLIEKLRRNLESEKETNSSLRDKLKDIELELKRENSLVGVQKNISNKNISITTLSSKCGPQDGESSDSISDLRSKVCELQGQLSEKTRQLKIRSQNMNDIKKALHKEISDHSKTQEELKRLQNQIKQVAQVKNEHANDNEISSNGSNQIDLDVNSNSRTNHQVPSDKNHEVKSSASLHDGCDDGPQMDVMSTLSRSSASVDEFDSSDLQHNNCNKEVNHEYLKNVLFRYMTLSDTETAQHLVKAISVMMNFSPEQSAAIKSAMNARFSWLRLKK